MTDYQYKPLKDIDSLSQGPLNAARERKKAAMRELKRLRVRLKYEPMPSRFNIRLEILRVTIAWKDAISDEKAALIAVERDANRLGFTIKKSKKS